MSLSQMRPQTSQLLELHVFYVSAEVWNFKLNTVPVALTSKFVSAGFVRVSPHITLRVLRERLGEYLGGVTVADKFRFLKCIGKKLAVNYTIIRIATVQHELHQLRRKLDDTKMRFLIEIKMRKQAVSDVRALRVELTQEEDSFCFNSPVQKIRNLRR
ncbi:hypothetical protein DV515_00004876 [Chloebia gouldiae]|uniref:Spermatogenesis-associated protein 1 C-terminal domain-containing protein n=1 Tax=Chloebia gouldiae TaxID=44316 RepID=A0A3L8SPZ5_CHLGU|nr:hypothetical protein DV515_00004876 [Chloebia gouldiae]